MADAPVIQLGRYKIVAELGRGAMGVVYRGEDALLNRTVAIKTIIMSSNAEERAEYEARFYQEAKAAGGLNHPNVITIYDIGREGDTAYMAMELLEGKDLRDMMKDGRVALPLALDLVAQAADGLAFAHEQGVVHRDIKPANVMVIRGRHAKIMDFGIARLRVSDVQTQAGAVLGSPKYMSPEQVGGLRADHRSDIFSLGIVLYELATGSAPFSAATVTGLMHKISAAAFPPASSVDPSLPSMLDLIIAKALAKEADTRYQDAAEMAADLRACLAQIGAGATAATDPRAPAGIALAKTADVTAAAAAAVEKTARMAPEPATGIEKTARIEAAPAPDVVLDATVAAEATRAAPRTRKTDFTGTSRTAGAGVTQLYLSRKLDSSEAIKQLEAMTASGLSAHVSGGEAGLTHRIWHDTDLRLLAAALGVAATTAVFIAVL
jgi:hypothetical protein